MHTTIAQIKDEHIRRFHAQTPIRAWSLIITIFGDCVAPRGGELWMGNLTVLMELLGISSGSVRTAMSRLAQDGWLERTRIGRNSFYKITPSGQQAFQEATRRIYATDPAPGNGHWVLAILADGEDRAERRAVLQKQGFGVLAPNVLIAPAKQEVLPESSAQNVFLHCEEPQHRSRQLAAQGWDLEALNTSYQGFQEHYADLHVWTQKNSQIDPETALLLRILLIHDLRRLVLRDPDLPAEALPGNWVGAEARSMAADIYKILQEPSEQWLNTHAKDRNGPLPAADAEFFERF